MVAAVLCNKIDAASNGLFGNGRHPNGLEPRLHMNTVLVSECIRKFSLPWFLSVEHIGQRLRNLRLSLHFVIRKQPVQIWAPQGKGHVVNILMRPSISRL